MDDIEVLNTKSKIIEGSYCIETDNSLPFRGNGWYNHSLTSFGLENSIYQEIILNLLFMLLLSET